MSVEIEMSVEHYDRFRAQLAINSRTHAILKNAVITRLVLNDRPVICIFCDRAEAEQLYYVAKRLHPPAAAFFADAGMYPDR